MLIFYRNHKSKALPFFIVLLCFSAIAPERAFPVFDGSGELFTEEEKEVQNTLKDVYPKIRPRAYILRGTLLYLMCPYKSKYYNVNSLGFRGEEVKPKKKNGFNIVVMGGSTVFGANQSDSQTIPALLEAMLQAKHPGRDIQVYNLGIPGYIFQREIALAKHSRKKLAPDLVIFYHMSNDLTIVYTNGYVRFHPFDKEEETFFVKKQLERNWGEALKGLVENAKARITSSPSYQIETPEKADSIAKGYLADAMGIMKYLNNGDHFRGKNIPILFVLQPTVFTRKSRTSREQMMVDACGKPDYSDFSNQCIAKIKASAQSEGITIHDFTGAFDEYEGELYRDEVHINGAGNKIVVEMLGNLIEEGGYLKAIKR